MSFFLALLVKSRENHKQALLLSPDLRGDRRGKADRKKRLEEPGRGGRAATPPTVPVLGLSASVEGALYGNMCQPAHVSFVVPSYQEKVQITCDTLLVV